MEAGRGDDCRGASEDRTRVKLPSKWVEGIDETTSLREAATLAIRPRLKAVEKLAPLAAERAHEDVEHVHQLRVWTRRCGAAIEAFSACAPEREAGKASRRLKRLRRASGEARDCDVHGLRFETMRKNAEGTRKRALAFIVEMTARERRAAQADIVRAVTRDGPTQLRRARKELTEAIAGTEPDERAATALDAARAALPQMIMRVQDAAEADLGSLEACHELRIHGKRLRYAMELFAGCFEESFRRDLYGELTEMQSYLGALNDAHLAVLRLERYAREVDEGESGGDWTPELRAELGAILREHEDERSQRHGEFLSWWSAFRGGEFFDRLERAVCDGQAPTHREIVQRAEAASVAPNNGSSRLGRERRTGAVLAAIDVGTNSIRLIVAEALAEGGYRLLDDEKAITRLGEGLNETGRLSPAAIERSSLAVARMRSIAEGYGAEAIRAVATSAAREAENGEELVEAVRAASGLDLEIISSEEEGRLAFLSCAHAFDLTSLPVVVADIGGGSTEVVHSSMGVVEGIEGIALGAVRLTERFGGPERAAGDRFEEMRRHAERALRDGISRPPFRAELMIGTGGTFTTLANIALRRRESMLEGASPTTVRGFECKRREVVEVRDWLRSMTLKARQRTPGLSPERADIIVAGLTLLECLMERLAIKRLRVHDQGIRDGLLLTMAGAAVEDAEAGDPRRAVDRFANNCTFERGHCDHVAQLALALFDQIAAKADEKRAKRFTGEARWLLEAASRLHDVGYHIAYKRHHLHSYHLIIHSDMSGFTGRHLQIVANIARYHRKAEPKKSHASYRALAPADRKLVRALSAILRVADGLDRTHTQRVRGVGMEMRGRLARLRVDAAEEPAVDIWGAARKGRLFEKVFDCDLELWWSAGDPSQSHALRATPSTEVEVSGL